MPNPVPGGARLRRATVLMLAALVAVPTAVTATSSSTAEADDGVPADSLVLPDDPAEADLGGVVGSLDARIEAERAEADAAAESLADARARLEAADAALAEAEHRVDALVPETGVLVGPGSFGLRSENSRPTVDERRDAGRQDSPRPAQGPLALTLTMDPADVERFVAARDRLAAEAEKRSDAEVTAREQTRRAQATQSEAEAAAARKTEFLAEAQQQLTKELDEATIGGDAERQAELKARRGELDRIVRAPARAAAARQEADAAARAKAEAAAAALRPGPIGRPTGRYPAVRCPGGGSITIDGSLAHNLNAMLLSAWRDGVNLCGSGYRDPGQQIQQRIQNCGSSDYAIYRMPSGSCSPPTAVPGTSMHERGLAIDFRCAGFAMPSRSSPCFGWMAGQAAAFGFFNLPSEPWHWSTSGS